MAATVHDSSSSVWQVIEARHIRRSRRLESTAPKL